MLEGRREKVMEFIIVSVEWVNLVIKVIFELKPFIFFLGEIVLPFLDLLKDSKMLLVLHLNYFMD